MPCGNIRVFLKCFSIDNYCYDSASFYRLPRKQSILGDFWSFSFFLSFFTESCITDVSCISIFIRFFGLKFVMHFSEPQFYSRFIVHFSFFHIVYDVAQQL